jgi:MFS family permease
MRTIEEEMRLKREQKKKAKAPAKKDASVDQSLKYSLWESGFFGAMFGATEQFFVPFALLFGAGSFAVGILTSLPNLLGSLIQLKAANLLKWFEFPRKYMVSLLAMQGVAILLIPALAFLENKLLALWLLILLVITSASLSLLVNPVWMSYMGDLVPDRKRNKHFGTRNAITGATMLIAILVGGWLLTEFTNVYLGFALLFTVAALSRWASTFCITLSKNLPAQLPSKTKYTISSFLKKAPSSDYGRFVRLAVLLRFSVFIASPFFVVWQLNILDFNYLQFTIIQASSAVATFLSVRMWSIFADKYGNKRLLMVTSMFITVMPFLWLISGAFPFLLATQFLSGAAWGGFNLASNNYTLEATSPRSRAHVIGFFNLFNNLGVFLGSILGSILMSLGGLLTTSVAFPFMFVFALSGVGRLLVWITHRSSLREVRLVQVSFKRKRGTNRSRLHRAQHRWFDALLRLASGKDHFPSQPIHITELGSSTSFPRWARVAISLQG